MAETNPVELQKALKGADYPADRKDLASRARENGADPGLVEKISDLSKKKFDGPDDVQREVFRSD